MKDQEQKLYVLFNGRFPSSKAAALFAAKTAESFADLGKDVVLLVSDRKHDKGDSFEYYAIQKNFTIVRVPCIELIQFPVLRMMSYYLNTYVFTYYVMRYLRQHASSKDLVYTTENYTALATSRLFRTCIEIHDLPGNKPAFYTRLFSRIQHVLITNAWKRKELLSKYPMLENKSFIELNAVDTRNFSSDISKDTAAQSLGLATGEKRVVYTGHLYEWKGVSVLIEAASLLPEFVIYIVGGTKGDTERYKKQCRHIKNVHILGSRPHSEMNAWQRSADVLVLPNTEKEDISKYYTSPMKLFEYLASARPVVASDLPSVREIVTEKEVYLVPPDDATLLAEGIMQAYTENDTQRLQKGLEKVQMHTWTSRAERILNYIYS